MSKSTLHRVAEKFKRQYSKPGSDIVSVGTTGNSIKVVVNSLAAAGHLPTKFEGFAVTVYQDCGPAGEKLILRDDDGAIIGAQG